MAWQAIASFLGKEGLKEMAKDKAVSEAKKYIKKQAVDFTKDRAKRAVVSAATRNSRGRGTDRKTLQRGYVNPTIGADGSFY